MYVAQSYPCSLPLHQQTFWISAPASVSSSSLQLKPEGHCSTVRNQELNSCAQTQVIKAPTPRVSNQVKHDL